MTTETIKPGEQLSTGALEKIEQLRTQPMTIHDKLLQAMYTEDTVRVWTIDEIAKRAQISHKVAGQNLGAIVKSHRPTVERRGIGRYQLNSVGLERAKRGGVEKGFRVEAKPTNGHTKIEAGIVKIKDLPDGAMLLKDQKTQKLYRATEVQHTLTDARTGEIYAY